MTPFDRGLTLLALQLDVSAHFGRLDPPGRDLPAWSCLCLLISWAGAGYRYLGCFKDAAARDLPVAMDVRPLTIKSCVLKCRDARFSVAGVQASSQCFCGDSYSRYGRLRNEHCGMRCTGNYREVCGGHMKNTIFYTGSVVTMCVNSKI